MTYTGLDEILAQYRSLAPAGWSEDIRPEEVPLLPPDALQFADDVAALGIPIMGVTEWSYTSDQSAIYEVPGGYYVGDEILCGEDATAQSLALVKIYITTGLHPSIHRVVLDLDLRDSHSKVVDCGQDQK